MLMEKGFLTTKECLQSKIQERNPGFKKKEYENIFYKFLGIKKVFLVK